MQPLKNMAMLLISNINTLSAENTTKIKVTQRMQNTMTERLKSNLKKLKDYAKNEKESEKKLMAKSLNNTSGV